MIATRHHQQSGFALILVLSFVVLITFVVVAFFSDSIFERRVSNGSANQSKVEIFARGALDTTVGDLRQEIVDGSTQVSANSTTTTPPYIYLPKPATAGVPSTMVPAYQITTGFKPTFNSSGLETDGLANVLKLSASGVPFYAQTANTNAGLSRACSVSTTTPSQNGHYISPARWNTPLLLPATSLTDTTPTATGFTAPNWILVANNSVTNPTTVSSNVVGRYAYTIYNEGGLLDMNMAGYPVETAPVLASHKMGVSLADLTQVGLTTAQIDTILGWRNNASAQPTGSYPSYTFNTTSGLNYFDAMFGNTAGFMSVNNTSLTSTNLSDQRFISRQHLINFLLQGVSNGTLTTQLQGALQYLGTFSRTVDQPSYRPDPDPTRPVVISYDTEMGTANLTSPGAGGNNAYVSGSVNDYVINPFFLQVPVTTTFTRNDGLSSAVVGEPLVKTRFGLNRLAWVTYKGPSADVYSSNPSDPVITQMLSQGISLQTIQSGTDLNVQKYFGLTWSTTNKYWTYQPPNAEVVTRIDRLTDLQTLSMPREPNFFELLKAAITVGSLGKSSASQHGSSMTTLDVQQYNLDTSTDYQIIQIGANIIDEFDSDSFPTHISFYSQDIYGDENIPYIYRTRAIGLNASGTGLMMLLPEVWNPHSPSSNAAVAGPVSFRLLTAAPLGTSFYAYAKCRAYPNETTTATIVTQQKPLPNSDLSFPLDSVAIAASGTSSGVTELDFTLPSINTTAQQYYEPFFIGGEKTGTGSASIGNAGGSNPAMTLYGGSAAGFITDSVSGLQYCGVLLGVFPLTFQSNASGTETTYPLPNTTPPRNPSTADQCALSLTGGGIYHYLQYKDPVSGNWITYQQNGATLPSYAQVSCAIGPNSLDASGNPEALHLDMTVGSQTTTSNDVISDANTGAWLTWMDPRTSRFGPSGNTYERSSGPVVESTGYYGASDQPTVGSFGQGASLFVPGTGVLGATSQSAITAANTATSTGVGWYPGTWAAGGATGSTIFAPGYYAQNVTGNQYSPQGNGNFYADPDGVIRRAMGGYSGAAPASPIGLPQIALATSTTQSQSRPFVLNRPFRSVAELGYTFSGTPWRNIDFSFPESGFSALLDVFCINDTPDPNALKAGKVDLNTRQLPVLEALLSGTSSQGFAYKDETTAGTTATTSSLSATEVQKIAQALIERTAYPNATDSYTTSTSLGALANVSELVGKWNASVTAAASTGAVFPFYIDGSKSYTGFSADLSTVFTDSSTLDIQRLRESAIRALSEAGQTRTWNLMIDLVAQTGRYRTGETKLSNFIVDGEQRYWLHVAIDRYTGKVVDEQLERVKE